MKNISSYIIFFFSGKIEQRVSTGFAVSLFILFFSFFGKAEAQCPEGEVVLSSQMDVNNFLVNYPSCTELTSLIITGSGITNLSPLNNITSVSGGVYINNINAASLNGLHNLITVGGTLDINNNPALQSVDLPVLQSSGFLRISNNDQLQSLAGLSGLASVSGIIHIDENDVLTDIMGLRNIDPATIGGPEGLYIVNNTSLSVCNLPNFCTYLQGTGNRTISGNAGNCISEQAVEDACSAACSGNLTFSTQAEIDSFASDYSYCSNVNLRNVTIEGADITNLDGLSGLTSISENLRIYNNPVLTDIDGLSSLQSIGVNFDFTLNPNVQNIEGLSSLETVGGYVEFMSNSSLENILGLSSLTSIGSYILFMANSSLENLNGIHNLTEINGEIYITNNAVLTDISGLQNIEPSTINGPQGLSIVNNPILSVCNLPNFCTYLSNPGNGRFIDGNAGFCLDEQAVVASCVPCPTEEDDFTFNNQQQIDDFGAMYAHCTDITLGNVTISGSDITDLSGLSNITEITEELWIGSNAQLTNVDGLDNLQNIGGYLLIYNNQQLNNLDGLTGLQSIGGYLKIEENDDLEDINGLNNLQSIGDYLMIYINPQLANLDGLSNLTSIGTELHINTNAVLTDISGLQNIDPSSIGGTLGLYIKHNPLLSVCNLPNFCEYLSNPSNPRTIENNAGDCISVQAVTDACVTACSALGDFTFTTQAEIDAFGTTYDFCPAITLGNLTISGADITNLDGLSSVTTIGGDLVISTNPQLQSLDGNITAVGGAVSVSQNALLTDISGLENIAAESIEDLHIVDNPLLSACDLLNFCTYLSNPVNPRTISGNLANCLDETTVMTACVPCPTGNFTFTTQQQIDDFGAMYAHCTDITLGDVSIYLNDITNLDGLSQVKAVTGELVLWENNQLTDINGLSSLESIGGTLWIHSASQLTNLDGFSSLQTVGNFSIQNNNALTDISGLSGLSSTKEVSIYNNPLLTNLDALSGLVAIDGTIGISENDSLTDISGLQNIDPETITYLTIQNNTDLSVCNLPNFCTYLSDETNPRIISGNAGFCLNEQDVNYHCLPCPTSEDDFTFNTQQQIDTFGEMYLHCDDIVLRNLIISGGDITNLDGLSHITGVTGNLTVQYTQLTGLNVFSNFTGIGGNLTIAGNSLLTTLDDLSNITTVEGNLDIGYNSLLINLDGLANLTNIEGTIHIFNHPALTDILGLANIEFATITGLNIENNPQLSVCNMSNFCIYLSDENNPRTINNNAGDCISSQAVENACADMCPTGNFYFTTQQQIDDFGTTYAHCTNITLNDVTISGTGITNLDGLSGLVNVEGNFYLQSINTLTNTNGLSNLTTVGGYFQISSLSTTSTALNLSGLTAVGEYLHIQDNSALTTIDLSSLISVDEELRITNNSALTAIDLSSLTTSPANILIDNNSALTNLNLSNLTTVGGLSIHNSTALPNLNTLSNLTTVGSGGLSINSNSSLTDIDGLGSLTTVGGSLGIVSIPSLTHLDALSNLTTLGGTLEIGLPQLTNLDGLSGLTSTGGINFSTNPSLTDIDGLSNITTLGGYLRINDVDALANLDALNGLTSIGGRIEITRNALLANLNGLSNVQSIQGEIRIGGFTASLGNPQLTDISGLQNIDPDGITNLYIRHNANLNVCNLPNFCEYLSNPAETHPRTIQQNAENCISPEVITTACAGSCGSYKVWNGNSWIAGEPNSAEKVFITGEYSPAADLEVCELEVAGTGKLTIPANVAVTVNGKITNHSGEENFIVESDGNLIQTATYIGANSGEITVKRNSTPMMRLDYALWSSPVDGQIIQSFSPNTVPSRIYTYEGENGYQVVTDPESSTFISGKGYMFRAPNNWNQTTDANGGNPVAYPGEFIGVPFNGDINVNVYPESYTSVGNPYPSNLNLGSIGNSGNDTFLGANPEVGTIYFWTNTNPADGAGGYTGNNWATYTLAGGTSASGGNVVPEEVIAPGQGFIISSSVSGTSVNFNNTMRTSEEALFFKNNEEEINRFWLNLKGDNSEDYNQILIGYLEWATEGVDHQIDGKMFGYEGSALFNLINEDKFTIQGRPLPFETTDVVPLGFIADSGGKFIISLNGYEGIFAEGGITIYAKDNVLGVTHNLMESDYEFESAAGKFTERFEIVYQEEETMGSDDLASGNIQIYKDKDYIIIDSKTEKILSVELYDLSGRNLYRKENINAKHHQIKSAPKGILIVKVLTENRKTVTKKVINK